MYVCEGQSLTDVGFPSACCECVLLSLVNKEAAFGQWLKRVKLGRKTKLNAGRKKVESREAM